MTRRIYSSWTTLVLFVAGWLVIVSFGYQKFGFAPNILIATVLSGLYVISLVAQRFYTYAEVTNTSFTVRRSLLFPEAPIPLSRIFYIARAPSFFVPSWGAQMIIFFRSRSGDIQQTTIPETSYGEAAMLQILSMLAERIPNVDIDDQYRTALISKEPISMSRSPAKSMAEIDAFVSAKYGR